MDKANAEEMSLVDYLKKRQEEQEGFGQDQSKAETDYWKSINKSPDEQKPQIFNKTKNVVANKPASFQQAPVPTKLDPALQEHVKGLKDDWGMGDDLAGDVIDNLLDSDISPQERYKRYNDMVNDESYSPEEKTKVSDFYGFQRQNDPDFL